MSGALLVTQKPRFYGVRTYRTAAILCVSSKQHLPAQVQWYKASMYNGERRLLEGQITRNSSLTRNAILYIHNLAEGDSGVYFCKLNNTWGPGTELQVASKLLRQHEDPWTVVVSQPVFVFDRPTTSLVSQHLWTLSKPNAGAE